jgi:polyisoprenyl-phosphate glycosyltransferase
MSSPQLSVVVPCYNEQEVILACYEALMHALSDKVYDFEIIFVNDGSKDTTLEILRGLHGVDRRVKVVDLSRNFGHQIAVSAGLAYTDGDAVAIIDADLQDPPELILQMLEIRNSGYDVVYGVRRARKGESRFKLLTAKWFYRILNRLSETQIPLDCGDFRLLDRRAVDALLRMREQHRLLRGMWSWIGFRQYALEYDRAPRAAGQTKYPFRKMLRLALDGILSFSVVPLRMVSFMGVATAILSSIGILYALVLRLFTRVWVPGWTMLFIGMMFLGGMQMLAIGVAGEYIGRIYTEVKQRPLYLVREVLSHTIRRDLLRPPAAGMPVHA